MEVIARKTTRAIRNCAMDWTAINSRNLTDAQKAQRNAEIVADAPSMTTYELAAKYGITPSGMCSVLQNANVKPKPGYVSMKGLVKKRTHERFKPEGATEMACRTCKIVKPMSEFRHKRNSCWPCVYAESRRVALANPERTRAYKKKHKDKNRTEYNRRQKERINSDPNLRLRDRISRRICSALKRFGTSKGGKKTMDLIGTTVPALRAHIESLWLPGMSWDNHAVDGWHIDHIKPCAKFNLEDPEQQKICFHWTNLQPLWAPDNISKSDKYPLDSFAGVSVLVHATAE